MAIYSLLQHHKMPRNSTEFFFSFFHCFIYISTVLSSRCALPEKKQYTFFTRSYYLSARMPSLHENLLCDYNVHQLRFAVHLIFTFIFYFIIQTFFLSPPHRSFFHFNHISLSCNKEFLLACCFFGYSLFRITCELNFIYRYFFLFLSPSSLRASVVLLMFFFPLHFFFHPHMFAVVK